MILLSTWIINTMMRNYCPDLFLNLFVQKTNENQVQLGHCCVSELSQPVDRIDFHHEFLQKNRQILLETHELPPSCGHCIRAEAIGLESRRTNHVKANWQPTEFKPLTHKPLIKRRQPVEFKLKNLDYNCDNICNLKCIMCSSYYSSSWIEDELKLGKPVEPRVKPTKHNNLIYDLDVTNINHLYFNGGEPLMTRDHINVLNHVIENGNASAVSVNYSSNGTFAITDELKSIWANFRKVHLGFSIDAAFEQYEYIRHPGVWSEVSKNLLEYRSLTSDTFTQSIQVTIGLHNILYFHELYNWANEHQFEVIIQNDTLGVSQLSLMNFPVAHKEYLITYLNELPDSMAKQTLLKMANHISGGNSRWISYLDRLDKIRGNNWRTTLSKVAALIKN